MTQSMTARATRWRASALTAVLLGGALLVTGCSGATTPGGGAAPADPSASGQPADPDATAPGGGGGGGTQDQNGSGKRPSPQGTADPDFPIPVADKVKKGATARFGTGVSAALVSSNVGRVDGKDRGAVAGPAYVARIRLTNGTDTPISLDTVSVTAVFGPDAIPGAPIPTDTKADPMKGTLEPGASASGRYVFALPDSNAATAQVAVGYIGDVPIVVFVDNFR